MQQLDGNNFAPTSATANPVIGVPSTGARGEITGGALETSTVDIATEFTNLLSTSADIRRIRRSSRRKTRSCSRPIALIANGISA